MASTDEFVSILARAAMQLELTATQPDEFGVCSVDLEDGYQLTIIAPPFVGFAYLAAPICLLDDLGGKSLYRRALESNYMLTQTRGATLAIDPDANQLLLCSRLRLETLSAEILAEEIDAIGAASQKLRETLLASAAPAEQGMPGAPGAPGAGFVSV